MSTEHDDTTSPRDLSHLPPPPAGPAGRAPVPGQWADQPAAPLGVPAGTTRRARRSGAVYPGMPWREFVRVQFFWSPWQVVKTFFLVCIVVTVVMNAVHPRPSTKRKVDPAPVIKAAGVVNESSAVGLQPGGGDRPCRSYTPQTAASVLGLDLFDAVDTPDGWIGQATYTGPAGELVAAFRHQVEGAGFTSNVRAPDGVETTIEPHREITVYATRKTAGPICSAPETMVMRLMVPTDTHHPTRVLLVHAG